MSHIATKVALNIQSDRGTWPYDIAATYFGKVRTPCDGGKMSDEFNLSKNPGWALWNRSKRISETIQRGRRSALILEKAMIDDDWPEEELGQLRQLVTRLSECANEAKSVWRELQTVLLLPDEDQLARVKEIGAAMEANTESLYLVERVEYLDIWVRKFQDS